jgi:hypothetical protein
MCANRFLTARNYDQTRVFEDLEDVDLNIMIFDDQICIDHKLTMQKKKPRD